MNSIKELDIFTSNPLRAFKNTGYYKHRGGWSWNSNCDYACFYCVEKGCVRVSLDDCDFLAEEGDVIFLRSSDRNAKLSAENGDIAYYFLSFYYDEDFSLEISTVTKDAGVINLFKDINEAHHSEAQLCKLKVSERFLKLLYILASRALNEDKGSAYTVKLRDAVEYINVNYYKRITAADLCAVSGYSAAHLRRLFMKHYGVSPQEYILNKKVDIAKEMLLDIPEKTVDEIADSLSVCSSSYLCKFFKRRVGMSPLKYKNTAKLAPSHE